MVDDFQNALYATFDKFAEKSFDMWKVTFQPNPEEWKGAVYTCPSFDVEYMCKHIIGIGKMIGIINQPEKNFDNQPLFKKTRGRPKRATRALNMG